MLAEYLPVILFLALAGIIGVALIVVGSVLGPRKPGDDKGTPYECGFEAFEDTRMKFDVRFYLVAILFIIFDLEIAFFMPWALVMENVGMVAFAAILIFTAELVIGYIYLWKKGALEWE